MRPDDMTRLESYLETFRSDNQREHREIMSKLSTLCTQTAVTETKVEALEAWRGGHDEDHQEDGRTKTGYAIAFIVLGLTVAAEIALTIWMG